MESTESVFKPLVPTTFEPFKPELLEPPPYCWPHGPPKATSRPQSSSLAIPARPYRRPSPPISPLDATDFFKPSPTSPLITMTRHIRPLFLPAALRPTEFPSKEPEPEPRPQPDEDEEENERRSHRSSLISLGSLGAFALFRPSTGDSGDAKPDYDLDLDSFPEPTGPPSRAHWKADGNAAMCDDVGCQRRFILFTRRHHCRKCGDIFCDLHSARVIPLDEKADYNPRGELSRSCEHCHSQFEAWCDKIKNPPAPAPVETKEVDQRPTIVFALPGRDLTAIGLFESAMAALSMAPTTYNWSTF